MRIGYSGRKQASDAAMRQLSAAGCERVECGTLKSVLSALDSGDVIVVPALTALGLASGSVLVAIGSLAKAGVGLVSLVEGIEATSTEGAFFHHAAALAALDARSHSGGRPKASPAAVERALELKASGEYSMDEICEICGLSRATIMRYAAKAQSAPT